MVSNDLIGEFEECKTAHDMWETLKLKYKCTLATRLRELTMNSNAIEHTTARQLGL